MGKAFFQFIVLALFFFIAWFALSRINYVQLFNLSNISGRTEKKVGDAIMKTLEHTNKKVGSDSVQQVLDKINKRLCGNSAAGIHIYLMQSGDINAFALPGHNLVVYTGLVKRCDSVSELCGVIAHEIGHIKLEHVMKRLAGELGLTVLTSMTANGKVASQAVKMLSSTAFERKQESEADAYSVSCLKNAGIDPAGFADFMMKIADTQSGIPEELEWISSHPDSKKRADAIRKLSVAPAQKGLPVITQEE